ncbi:MAG: macro domain-containing protein [Fibrobacteres bacterium]|nr:macro domain-containing protein [Fibrobacterota bacterium]
MIDFVHGNILEAPVQAAVNAVNTKGVMGKGLALQFKKAFPQASQAYEQAARRGDLMPGGVLLTESGQLGTIRYVLHAATKDHWRNPSHLEWVESALEQLVEIVRTHSIESIALPALGCGLGGLAWPTVKASMEVILAKLPETRILVYLPQ